ncbi:MAG: hypothetical protein M1305_02440 [Candidatus Marsarchaeota archaeon]|nr:hypothetical protein [Candidatus Marsarchaeota archaeon]
MTTVKVEIPWERYGTIAYIAEHVMMCGKTALQKLVYFLQEWKHVPLCYNYEFYTYGPFSSELMGDLDFSDSLGAVRVEAVASGGFCIESGERSQEIKDRAKAFLSEHQMAIDEVINVFGRSSAVRLELLATTHYAFAYFSSQSGVSNDEQVVQAVHSLKPGKFTTEQIRDAISFLREKSVLAC